MTQEEFDQWVKGWDGRCPFCPNVEMKPRRSRCPYCGEWVTYTPDHPGHKYPRLGSRWNSRLLIDVPTGKIVWSKPIVGRAWIALMGHLNTAASHKKA